MNNNKDLFEQAKNSDNFILETVNENEIFGDNQNFNFNAGNTNSEIPNATANQNTYTHAQDAQNNGTKINLGQTVEASVLIGVIDNAAPPVMKLLLGFAGINNFKVQQLKLSAGEKNYLEEPMQNYLNTVEIKLSPLEGLLIAFGSVYAGKIFTIVTDEKSRAPKEPAAHDLNSANVYKKPRKPRSDKGTRNPNNSRKSNGE